MKNIKKSYILVNGITVIRVAGGIALIFLQPLSVAFFIVYAACGISDMIDGLLARKLNATSKFGERLDTFADFVFFTICAVIIIVNFNIETWAWWVICASVACKIASILTCIFIDKKLVLPHSAINKVTGVVLFAIPFVSYWVSISILLCVGAGLAMVASASDIALAIKTNPHRHK